MVKNNETIHTWLFGGGGAASYIVSGIVREGISIAGILDDSLPQTEQGENTKGISGIPLFSPKSTALTSEIKKNSVVIMGILNPLVDITLITKRLLNDGWGEVVEYAIWVENEYRKHGKCPSPISSRDWKDHVTNLQQVRNEFADEKSVQIFDAFLNFVYTGKNEFPEIEMNPYFPTDISRTETPLRMIDCGAFTGDTILQAQSTGYSIEVVHAFEPDMTNYAKLCSSMKNINQVVCWPCGTSSKTESIRFETQGDMGSFTSPEGNTLIQCVSIDDCIPNFNVNFIKMDIEGSEYDTLRGAESVLRKYRPRLAISVYHLSSDIWKIPLWIREVYGKTAKFYLRHHSRTIADTILYVLP